MTGVYAPVATRNTTMAIISFHFYGCLPGPPDISRWNEKLEMGVGLQRKQRISIVEF